MKVLKFGGVSIQTVSAIRNVANIIKGYQGEKLLVVVSAMGKTTNALEAILDDYYTGKKEALSQKVEQLKEQHQVILEALFAPEHWIYDEIHDCLVDLEWILEEEVADTYGYLYDQIVSTGEFLSTQIVAAYLSLSDIPTSWLDVRDCIATDNTYRAAKVDWELTKENINRIVPPLLEKGIVLTQGFVGGTSENFTTTLGREGSDFSAAIFSYCLAASQMIIWKDVAGVLTADPNLFSNATKLDYLSYAEAIEMTYYGAKVIHPKTIRPLQNKQIELQVKSFLQPKEMGTIIGNFESIDYLPMLAVKEQQILLKIESKDFYFIEESKLALLFAAFAECAIKVNMIQKTALAFAVCVDNNGAKIEKLAKLIASNYTLKKIENLKLITVRYGTEKLQTSLTKKTKVYLESKLDDTFQLLVNELAIKKL